MFGSAGSEEHNDTSILPAFLQTSRQAPRWFNRQLLCSQAPAEPIPLDDVTLFAVERSEQDGGPLVIEAATAEAADGWWAFRNDDGRTLKTLPTAAEEHNDTSILPAFLQTSRQAPRWFNRQLLCSQAPAEPIPLDDVTLFAVERSEQDGGPLVIEAATAEAADGWWAFRNDDGRTLKTLPTAAVRGIETVQSRRPWPGRINAHRPSGLVPAASGLHRVA